MEEFKQSLAALIDQAIAEGANALDLAASLSEAAATLEAGPEEEESTEEDVAEDPAED